jgi:hypothetical protein
MVEQFIALCRSLTLSSPHQTPIGVGIVGLSARRGWASQAHLPALQQLDGFELRALSASSAESARQASEKYGVAQFFGTAGELAAADGVDLVVVTVKVPDHREIIQSALAARKMVLSEWPLGNGTAEAEELATAAAERTRGLVQVSCSWRPLPPEEEGWTAGHDALGARARDRESITRLRPGLFRDSPRAASFR